jgi:hypothetical protein
MLYSTEGGGPAPTGESGPGRHGTGIARRALLRWLSANRLGRGWQPGSDSEDEFGEGRREPVLRFGVNSEFIVAAAEVLYERMPCADHPC